MINLDNDTIDKHKYSDKFRKEHIDCLELNIKNNKFKNLDEILNITDKYTGFKLFDKDYDSFKNIIEVKPWLITMAKITLSHLDSLFGYTGFLTGFQGFIINEYVDSKFTSRISETDGKTIINCDEQPCFGNISFSAELDNNDDGLSLIFQVGFFFMVISFCINITVCLLTFLLGLQIRGGFYKKSYIFLTDISKYLSVFGSSTFTLSILILLYTIQINDYLLYSIYIVVVICNILINSVIISENYKNIRIWRSHKGRNLAYYIAKNIHE